MSTKSKPQSKNKAATGKSPSNNRKNPAENTSLLGVLKNEWRVVIASFIAGVVVMAIGVAAFDSYQNYAVLLAEKEKRAELLGEVGKWEKIVAEYPDYRDAHFTLALLYYQVQDKGRSSYHLDQSLKIDPNFAKGRELRELISEK